MRPGESVLDLACGTGRVTRQLVRLLGVGSYLAALDNSAAMLGFARNVVGPADADVDWREDDAANLPFENATFDLVICQQGLQYFSDREAALHEVRRVLKPGGRFALRLDRQPIRGPLHDAFSRHLGVPSSTVAPPFAFGNAAMIRTLLINVGFRDVEITVDTIEAHFPSASQYVEQQFNAAARTAPA